MIKAIMKKLSAHENISDWLLTTTHTRRHEAFYVMHERETRRLVDTTTYEATVYRRFKKNGDSHMGSATFKIPSEADEKTLDSMIEDAAYAASLSKNKPYDLVTSDARKTFNEPPLSDAPFSLLDEIATTFATKTDKNTRFNAMECFHTETTIRIINSKGLDYDKTLRKVQVEAIPSYDGEAGNVELYRFFTYGSIDFEKITADAETAIEDVTARYHAQNKPDIEKSDIILRKDDAATLFRRLISDFSYAGVYRGGTEKKPGDPIQKDAKKDTLTIALVPSSQGDAFDDDGVLLRPITVLEDGVLKNHYGSNQYAQYLGNKPSGRLNKLSVATGDTPVTSMRKDRTLEIVALSSIQIEPYSGYIGGEVRLALYHDGSKTIPVSGFSFSGNLDEMLARLTLSDATADTARYHGPAFVRLGPVTVT